jgi:hypothetical protein
MRMILHYFHVCGIKETKGKYDEFGHVSINDLNYAWAFTHHLLLQHWSQHTIFFAIMSWEVIGQRTTTSTMHGSQ